MDASQAAALEGPIVAAACRHYQLPPDAVTVLGHRTISEHDDSAHPRGRVLHENHTYAETSLELREWTDKAIATAARALEPLDLEALRDEFVKHGAVELGIDVGALEIVLTEATVQVRSCT